MTYLRKFLPKEANEILTQCGTDGHQAVQLLHLKIHPIHFRYQTNQCKTVPIQGNLTINAYTSNYNWYVINRTLILNQKNDISNEHTQDMFISNMKQCDDVHSIVTFEKTFPDQWIKDWYKGENFMNTISNLYNGLPPTTNTSGRAFSGRSQTNVHSIVPYDVENNGDDWNGPPEYDYCRPGADPDFNSFQSLMSISYSDCDVNTLAYKTCKHAEKIFNNGVVSIIPNLNRAFDTTRQCAICGETGRTFDDCEELRDQAAIRKSDIQLCVALQKLKGIAASQGCNVNFLQSYKLSYVNSVDLNPPSLVSLDSVAANRLDKMEGLLVKVVKNINYLTLKLARNDEDDDDDQDDNSQSSFKRINMRDFLKDAQS